MDNFLDSYKIPKVNRDQTDHLNNPTTPKEIEVVIEILPFPQRNYFSAELYQTLK